MNHFKRQCLDRHTKGGSKGSNNEARTFYLGATWTLDSELFGPEVLQADAVFDCGATETAGGVEAGQILVDAVRQGFSRFVQTKRVSGRANEEGNQRSVPLRRAPSGHRILTSAVLGTAHRVAFPSRDSNSVEENTHGMSCQ